MPEKIDLNKFYDVVAACNRCGFCTSFCPTYNSSGAEIHSPRGRNQAFRALIEGKIKNPEETKEIIDTCLLCGECTSVCFAEVPTAALMVQARQMLNEQMGLPKGLKYFLDKILPNPGLFRKFLKVAFLGKKLKISALLNRTGLLKKLAPALAAADELTDDVPLEFLLDSKVAEPYLERTFEKAQHEILHAQKKATDLQKKGQPVPTALLEKSKEIPPKAKVAYMAVCGSQYVKPQIGIASLKLCKLLNVDMSIPDLVCCGLPAASYGVLERVGHFAMENIRRIEEGKFEALIVDDSSCTAHFKDYPTYFQGDMNWYGRASALNQKIKDFSQFLWGRGLQNKLSGIAWKGGPVAFHDPCKAQYGQKLVDPPRQLLTSIPGLKLVAIPDADQCCGGGGTYSFTHPEMSQDIVSKKILNILSVKPQIVLTTSTSCLIQLQSGLRKVNAKIEVLHLTEFLVRVLKI